MTEREEKEKLWNEQIEALARFLCEEKGQDPDYICDVPHPHWEYYKEDAEKYLRQRTLNKYYWDCLCSHE